MRNEGASDIRLAFAGDLAVSSGHIVGRDPYTRSSHGAYTTTMPTGIYPVYLSIVRESLGELVIAAASLRFREERPTRWEMAMRNGQRRARLRPGQIFGYPVESGLGCFVDREGETLLQRSFLQGDQETFEQGRRWIPDTACEWGSMTLDPQTGQNLIFFTTGYGDNVYPSYIGYSATGELIGVLSDFGVLDAPTLSDQERLSCLYLSATTRFPVHHLYRGVGTQIVVPGWLGDRAYLASDHYPSREAQRWGYKVYRVPKDEDVRGVVLVTRFPSFFVPDEQLSAPCHYVAECDAPAFIGCAHCQRRYCVKCATELLAKGADAAEEDSDYGAHCPECHYPKRQRRQTKEARQEEKH